LPGRHTVIAEKGVALICVSELTERLCRILDDYEARRREPQRVLEMVACLVREYAESQGTQSDPIEQIQLTVKVWERGERPDLDALETIAALTRQLQG